MEERKQQAGEPGGQAQEGTSQGGPGQRVVSARRVTAGGANMLIETFADGSVAVDGKKVTPYRSEEGTL
jgi:hypothetical protein